MNCLVKQRTFSTPPGELTYLSSETSTQLEDADRSPSFSPLMLSSSTSEYIDTKQDRGSEVCISEFSLKKEPAKSRIKTIGRSLTHFKKTFSSLNDRKPSLQDALIQDSVNEQTPIKMAEKYEFLEVLGKGAQGIVYKVMNKESKELYAAKKIYVSDSETYQNIQNEIKLLQEIKHENVIQVYEIINDDNNNCIYCVQEYFPCKSLYDFLKSNPDITHDQIKGIISKILNSLEYLHERNICHRDLTLNNVLVSEDLKTVKLIDFGVAKKASNPERLMLSPVGKSTNMPPEFEYEGCYSSKYDIWLTGLLLLQFNYKIQISSKTAQQIVKGLQEKNQKFCKLFHLGDEAEDLIIRLLDSNPESRITAKNALLHKWFLN